ncbi:MAG TPA: tetratricopeptide repeat protein [Candidatus Limnocylindrales bacterium]|nr:tetratricopeptide repeat protein [Candidatus Limnocylindrales bacterium]
MRGWALSGRRLLSDTALALAVTVVLALGLYAGTLAYPLVYDSITWFSADNLRALGDHASPDRFVSRKVTYWLHRLLEGRLDLFRLAHIALHAFTACLAFLLLRRLGPLALPIPPSGSPRPAFWTALAAAMLFTLHPVSVYAVVDPGQMELVLATLFGVAMLLAYLEGLERPSRGLLLVSLVLYLLAVLSKENVIALPAVALAMTLLVRRPSWALVRQLAPWYGLLGLVAIWILVGELQQSHPVSEALRPAPGEEHVRLRSMVTQGWLFFRYLFLWLVPYVGWMSIDVQYPLAPGALSWPETAGFVGFWLYPIAAGWLLLRGGRRGLVGFGLLWPWLLFLPELTATRITEAFVLYRSYPWMLGPLVALVAAAAPMLGRSGGPLLCVACIGLGALTHERLATFRLAFTVWDDAVRKNQAHERRVVGAHRAYLNRGQALLQLERMDAALADFDRALALRPGLAYAHLNRGLAYIRLRRYPEALVAFDEGLAHAAEMPPRARARAHSNRAGLYLLMGRSNEAIADLAQAASLDPARAEYRVNLERLRAETSR